MENRHGLCADIQLHNPITQREPAVALSQMQNLTKLHEGTRPRTIAADKGYHERAFVAHCRERGIRPHVAQKDGLKTPGMDGRTTRGDAYRSSQRIRKRVEEIFGWMKTIGGLRRSRYRGLDRTQAWGYFVAGAYNLIRMATLEKANT